MIHETILSWWYYRLGVSIRVMIELIIISQCSAVPAIIGAAPLPFFLYSWWKFGLYSFNIVVQQTYHDSKMKGHWVAKLEELRRHRCQSICVCNEPFTLGGNYVLSISDNDLGSKQKKPCSRLIETLRYHDELLTYGPIAKSSNQ